jgi:hypothetical protein
MLAPPMTVVDDSVSADSVIGAGAVVVPSTRNRRTSDHGPAVPALLRARTRHQYSRLDNDDAMNSELLTVRLITGDEKVLESSTCN